MSKEKETIVAKEDMAKEPKGYDPRKDFGPERHEDLNAPKQENPAKLSAKEVDPEEARKDETSVLATDVFDSEGNRIN